jgi:peptide/nickel transport system substrate-binding protein
MMADENGNREWQLAELVDAVAAEIDHAEDTLSLKSYARGMSFAIKQLSLDLEVTARRDEDGRVLFRTVEGDQTSATVLKLDFAQMLQSQLEGLRKPLDRPTDTRELATLPGITAAQITALNTIAIFSVGDLERYTKTAAMVAEVSRKTGIEDVQIRKWRRLPFFTEAKPASGRPGSTVLIEGGNFGGAHDPNAVVLFQGQPAAITSWSESRLIVTMPQTPGTGVLFAVVGGQPTNTIAWEATAADLLVREVVVDPADPIEGETITVEADLINQGTSASGAFQVQWMIDDEPQPPQSHGTLQAGQHSTESSIRRQLTLDAGPHTIRFTADPAGQVPDVDRSNSTLSRRVEINPLQRLVVGDFRGLEALDPLLSEDLGPADALSLVFRGLCRLDPKAGRLFMDVAAAIAVDDIPIAGIETDVSVPHTAGELSGSVTVAFKLRKGVRFHDGSALTPEDVAFTYQRIMESASSPWYELATKHIASVTVVDDGVVALVLQGALKAIPPRLLTIGVVPRRTYESDSDGFGARPVGGGPFRVEDFVPGETIDLRGFKGYAPVAPRLDEIEIHTVKDVDRLAGMVSAHEVTAAVLPYSEELYKELEGSDGWNLVALPGDQPQLLHAQSPDLFERAPNAFDTNWNAHLWYMRTGGTVLYALMTSSFSDDSFSPPQSAIEVVDLSGGSTMRAFSIGNREVSSLAVSPDGLRLYVTDRTNGAVAVFSGTTGAMIATVAVSEPRDCVLSTDGSTLYVSAGRSVVAVDTATNSIGRKLATGEDTPLGIGVSPEEDVLAVASSRGGSDPALYLIDVATLALRARVPITNPGEPTNCATFPTDVAFTDTGRVLLWDSNCDNLYQVEVATRKQLTSATIRLGRDAASSANFNNVLSYSPTSARAYAIKESTRDSNVPVLAVMDPSAGVVSLTDGAAGRPFAAGLAPGGEALLVSVIHRFSGGGADTLDCYDAVRGTVERNVYTLSRSNMSVRDMRTLRLP